MKTPIRRLGSSKPLSAVLVAAFVATLFGACFTEPDDSLGNPNIVGSISIDVVSIVKGDIRATSWKGPVLGGDTLVANTSDLQRRYGSGPDTYQWRREKGGDSKATDVRGQEYDLGEDDFGASLMVVAFHSEYNGGIISRPSPIATLPVTEETPDINEQGLVLKVEGYPDVKEELRARIFEDLGRIDEPAEIDSYDGFFFQWLRSEPNNPEEFVPILGATEQTYLTQRADLGRYLMAVAVKVGHGSLLSTVFGPVGTHLGAGLPDGVIRKGIGGLVIVPLNISGFYDPPGSLSFGEPGSGADLIVTGVPKSVTFGSSNFFYGPAASGVGNLNLIGDKDAEEGMYPITVTTRTGSTKVEVTILVSDGTVLIAGEPEGLIQAGVGGEVTVKVIIEGYHKPSGHLTFGLGDHSGADLYVLGLDKDIQIAPDSYVDHAGEYGEGILHLTAGPDLHSGPRTVSISSSMGLIMDTFQLMVQPGAGLDAGIFSSTIQENVGGEAEIPVTFSGYHPAGLLTFGDASSGADLIVEGLPANVSVDPSSSVDHNGTNLGTGTLKLTANKQVRVETKQVTIRTKNGGISTTFFLRVRPTAKFKIGHPEGTLQEGESGLSVEIPVMLDGFHIGDNLSFGTGASADLQVTGLPVGVSVDGKSFLEYDSVRELGDGILALNAAPEVKEGKYTVKIRSDRGNTEGEFDLLVYGRASISAGSVRGTVQNGRPGGRLDVKIDIKNFSGRNGYLDFGTDAPSQIRVNPETGTMPAGILISGLIGYSNANNSGSGDLTFFVDADVPAGKYPMIVAFDDGRAQTRIELQVRSLEVSQAYNHTAFQAGVAGKRTMPVSVVQYDGTGNLNFGNGTGELKLSGLPSGVTVAGSVGYDAGTGTGTGNLELSTAIGTPAGVYDVRMEFGNNSEVYGRFKLYVQELTVTHTRPVEDEEKGFILYCGVSITYDDPVNLILDARFLHPDIQSNVQLPGGGDTEDRIPAGLSMKTIARFEVRADGTGSGTFGMTGFPLSIAAEKIKPRHPVIRVNDLNAGFTMTAEWPPFPPFILMGPEDGSLNGVLTVTKGQGEVTLPINVNALLMNPVPRKYFYINENAGFSDPAPSVFFETDTKIEVVEEKSFVDYDQGAFHATGQLVLNITEDTVPGRHVFSMRYGAGQFNNSNHGNARPEVIFVVNVK
ncbi:MAG: hypothetical protein FWD94_02460 [Treponema sp.]|nr:hypothetical protein [Treponema sp.]